MNDITSRASLQQVAEGELGLVKADPSQITYVQLEDQSIIERNTGAAGRLLDEVRTAALSLLEQPGTRKTTKNMQLRACCTALLPSAKRLLK